KMAKGTPSSRTATATATIVAWTMRWRMWLARADLEAEAETAHRGDVARRVRVVAQLATQPRHVHVEGLGGSDRVGTPHVTHQGDPHDHGTGVLHQHPE